jgi:hypothetical protein
MKMTSPPVARCVRNRDVAVCVFGTGRPERVAEQAATRGGH